MGQETLLYLLKPREFANHPKYIKQLLNEYGLDPLSGRRLTAFKERANKHQLSEFYK